MAGASAGGFAAMQLGVLCDVDEVLAFSPQTFVDAANRRAAGDNRWPEQITALHAAAQQRALRSTCSTSCLSGSARRGIAFTSAPTSRSICSMRTGSATWRTSRSWSTRQAGIAWSRRCAIAACCGRCCWRRWASRVRRCRRSEARRTLWETDAGVTQLVEFLPSKQVVAGSSPVPRSTKDRITSRT